MKVRCVLAAAIAVTACSPARDASGPACEVLARPVDVPGAIAGAVIGLFDAEPTVADVLTASSDHGLLVVYLEPERSTEVATLADELERDGLEVVDVVDQDEAYEEFAVLFADDGPLVASVEPAALPASVRVRVPPDGAPDLSADPRVREVVDGVRAMFNVVARLLELADDDVEELARVAPRDVAAAVDQIADAVGDGSEVAELPADAVAVVRRFVSDECRG